MSENRRSDDYINDIKEAIDDIADFTGGMSFEEFTSDKKTINAVIRSLEVLGEATKNIPSSIRNQYPDIPWKQMAGMRDVLIHNYMGVDLMTVWKVVEDRLPDLKSKIAKIP
ncbi:MAG: DUF86 domain-containing protein [Desulfuromonadales bacterium]|nr:DUF86 domain-containing protein [Desulfuromonadales bacterium]